MHNEKPKHFPSKEQIHSQETSLTQPVLKYLLQSNMMLQRGIYIT